MPYLKSAKKRLRKTARKTVVNKKVRSRLKTEDKNACAAIVTGDKEQAKQLVLKVQKSLDSAAHKGRIKRNTASRRKSRLMRALNKLSAK